MTNVISYFHMPILWSTRIRHNYWEELISDGKYLTSSLRLFILFRCNLCKYTLRITVSRQPETAVSDKHCYSASDSKWKSISKRASHRSILDLLPARTFITLLWRCNRPHEWDIPSEQIVEHNWRSECKILSNLPSQTSRKKSKIA